jgi:hypothetical protein
VNHYFENKEIPPLKEKEPPPRLDHTEKVSKAHILESMALLRSRDPEGLKTNYLVILNHLKSEVRLHPYLDLDNCPPVELTRDVIRYAMRCEILTTKVV